MLSFFGVHIGFYEWGGADFDYEGSRFRWENINLNIPF